MRRLTVNIISSVVYRASVLLTGLIIQQKILTVFGSDINGLTSGVSQLLSFLALVEAGIGAATIQALHKPLAENDTNQTNSVLASGKQLYTKAGMLFSLGLLVLSAIMALVLHSQLSAALVAAVTLVSGASTVISYTFCGKYSALLISDCRSGVIYITDTAVTLASCAVRLIIVSVCGDKINDIAVIAIQAVPAVGAVFRCLVFGTYVKYRYPELNYRAKPTSDFSGNRRSALIHQLTATVVTHTDIALLTLTASLKSVSLYSVYNYIYSSIYTVLNTVFSQAILGYFGKSTALGQEEYNKRYVKFEAVYTAILYYILTLALALTLPFIRLYTNGVTDIEYIDPKLALLFFVITLISLVRLPMIVTVTAYGHFKQTQNGAIIECIINIVASLLLFPCLGIYGLLLGTLCSYIFRTQDMIRYTYKTFGLRYSDLFKANIGNITASIAVTLITLVLFPITACNWLDWCFKAVLTALLSAVLFVLANVAVNNSMWKEIMKSLRNSEQASK